MNHKEILHVMVENRDAAVAAAKYLGYSEVSNVSLPVVSANTNLVSAYLVGRQDKVKDHEGRTLIEEKEFFNLCREGKVLFNGVVIDAAGRYPDLDAKRKDGRRTLEGVWVDRMFLRGLFWWVCPDGSIHGAGGRWKIVL